MHKKIKGSFSLEASMILPIVLFLYLMIILAALFLYCRCAISQDTFLLNMRAGRFTYGENNYGEVIYGEEENNWSPEGYISKRYEWKKSTYPGYPPTGIKCQVTEADAFVAVWEKGLKAPIIKKVQRVNPVKLIREGRRKDYA